MDESPVSAGLLRGSNPAFQRKLEACLYDHRSRASSETDVFMPEPGRNATRGGASIETQDWSATHARYARFGKRAFDLAFASLFMLLLGFWLLPLIGLLIKLDSRGPVFFRQFRLGANGVQFRCFKFRTMTHDPKAGFVQAQKNDPRVTRVGRILRKTNLDELPQFLNVLMGEMSVVGPRPHVPELDELFAECVPGYSMRTSVLPGVTGLAQVSGCRGETRSIRKMTHRVRFDLFYARNMSLRMDIKIVFLTVWRALSGDEYAY